MGSRHHVSVLLVSIIAVAVVLSAPVSGQGKQHSTGEGSKSAPCFDNANRYVDCGNGTVTDTHTGLIWLQDAGCLGVSDWATANKAAASLRNHDYGLTDGSFASAHT